MMILEPTHGTPWTLVTFQGVGWYLQEVTPCWIDGIPVRIDRYAECEIRYSGLPLVTVIATGGTVYGQSSLEPTGTFLVADVPPGVYLVTVTVGHPGGLTADQPFIVDGYITTSPTTTTTYHNSLTSGQTTLIPLEVATTLLVTHTISVTHTAQLTQTVTVQLADVASVAVAIVAAALIIALVIYATHGRPEDRSSEGESSPNQIADNTEHVSE
jgi:hypothetical protein